MDRETLYEELQERIRASGGALVQTGKSLADELGMKAERFYYLVHDLERKGKLTTVNHGPRGIEFRVGSGQEDGEAAVVGGRGRRGSAAAAEGGRGARGGSRFCPWCGRPAQNAWTYCAGCGEKLPVVK